MLGVTRSQLNSFTAAALIGLLPAPLYALGVGAGVSIGGSSANASVSVGGGGVSADTSASIGGGVSADTSVSIGGSTSVGASVSVGTSTSTPTGTTATPTQPSLAQTAPPSSAAPALLVLIGMTLMSSDNVPLGQVIAAEKRADGTTVLRVSISEYIKTDKKTARVVFDGLPRHNGTVRLAMTAKRFVETL